MGAFTEVKDLLLHVKLTLIKLEIKKIREAIPSGAVAAKQVLLGRKVERTSVLDGSSPSPEDLWSRSASSPTRLIDVFKLTLNNSVNLSHPLRGLLLGGGLVHLPVCPEKSVRFSLMT